MTEKEKKSSLKIKGLNIKVEKDEKKKRKLKIKDHKGIKISVEKEIDSDLVDKSSKTSSYSKEDYKIKSINDFELKEKKISSIKISKFNKLDVKDNYKPLIKSSFQSLIELISGKIYNSLNFLNLLLDFFSICNSEHKTEDYMSALNNLIMISKKQFPELDISSNIQKTKQKLVELKHEKITQRILAYLQYNIINWANKILDFGENNTKLYLSSNSFEGNPEIIKKIEWSFNRIKNNLNNIEKQYISNILTHLMIIMKKSGVVLIANSFIEEDLEGDLIGGFLTAIQSFGLEISKKETSMKKLSYQDFEIEIEDGNYIRIALILQGQPIPLISQKLNNFCSNFESHFESLLQNFDGDISLFLEETPKIINEIFS